MNDNDDANAVDGIIKVDKYLRKNTTSPLVATKNKYGHSPLYTAARSGSAATVSTLIKHNADVESKNGKNCKSPLCIAIQNGHLEIVQYMLEETKGKLADSPCDKDLNSPLHIENNNFHMTNLLLMEDRADIHAKNKYGKKPYQANLPTDVKELYDLKKIFDRELQAEEHPHMSSEDKRSQRLRNFNKPVEVKTSRSFMMRYLVPSCIQSKK